MEGIHLQDQGKYSFPCLNNPLESGKNPLQTIGIVGGMGPMAGVELHRRIITSLSVDKDQDHPSVIHISRSRNIPDRTEFLNGLVSENPAGSIVQVIQELDQLGADVVGIPCNTSHAYPIFSRISEEVDHLGLKVGLRNMVLETAAYVASVLPSITRLGILCTNGSYEARLYEQELAIAGLEAIYPDRQLQYEMVHQLIYDPAIGIKCSRSIHGSHEKRLQLIMGYFEDRGVDAILLGCTELSLLPQSWFLGYSLVDPLTVLATSLLGDSRAQSEPLFHGSQLAEV